MRMPTARAIPGEPPGGQGARRCAAGWTDGRGWAATCDGATAAPQLAVSIPSTAIAVMPRLERDDPVDPLSARVTAIPLLASYC